MDVLRGGVEEEEYSCGVEHEEQNVEHRDFFSNRVDLGFFQRNSAEYQFLFLEPLLEKKFVGWIFGNLVKWVWWL